MAKIIKNCKFCNKEFKTEQKYINRGNGIFCSKSCSSKFQMQEKYNEIGANEKCAWCNKSIYISPTRKSRSKSGLFFCCRKHKDLAQRLTGLSEITPAHYNTDSTNYREAALREFEHKCDICNYNKNYKVLQVHHKDFNHNNNNITNLQILCPTCHMELHYPS